MIRATYDAKEIWSASYLLAKGVPLVGAHMSDLGRVRWEFSNANDRAWQVSKEWWGREGTMVNGYTLMQAYREAQRVANIARRDGEYRTDADRSE